MSEQPFRAEQAERPAPEPAPQATPPAGAPSRAPARVGVGNLRRLFTKVGLASLVAAGLSLGMLLGALAAGVHCPECDRWKLGASYESWSTYFAVQHALAIAGIISGLAAVWLAERRRYAAAALLLTLVLTLFTFH